MRLNELKKIIKALEQSDVEEIEIKGIFRSVRVSKKAQAKSQMGSQLEVAPTKGVQEIQVQAKAPETKKSDNLVAIKASMVGTFYHAPAPDASPYVEVGDKIQKGKVLCIIEAMKVMNEIEADVDGIVEKILVKNEEPVEYGQELFLIKVEKTQKLTPPEADD